MVLCYRTSVSLQRIELDVNLIEYEKIIEYLMALKRGSA